MMEQPRAYPLKQSNQNKGRLIFVLSLTSIYFVVEVVGGLLTHSLALLADAGHMLADIGAIAIALFAIKVAERPPTAQKTFGYLRAEILAAFVNASGLILVSFYILYEAVNRFTHPGEVSAEGMLWIASFGLVVNVMGAIAMKENSRKNLNMKGAYYEVLVDLISSVGVIIAALIIQETKWYYADPVISTLIGLSILPGTWVLLQEITGILLEGAPAHIDSRAVRDKIREIHGVLDVHDLHIWCLTSGINALSAHIVAADRLPNNYVLNSVFDCVIHNFQIARVTIQIEHPGFRACSRPTLTTCAGGVYSTIPDGGS